MGIFDSVKDTLFGSKPESIDAQGLLDLYFRQQRRTRRHQRQQQQQIRAARGDIQQQYKAAAADTRRGGVLEKGNIMSALQSRGMLNTTLQTALNNRVNERTQRELNRIRGDRGAALAGLRDRMQQVIGQRAAFEGSQLIPLQQQLADIGFYNANRRRAGGIFGGLQQGFGQAAGESLGSTFGNLVSSWLPI